MVTFFFRHIRHDLEGQINKPKEQMTPEEQNFYYFKLHDTNNDNRLDGLEVVAAFDHVHQEENSNATDTQHTAQAHERLADEELIRLVDDILKEEDLDRDGFISYEEFKRAIEGNPSSQG
jgi:multiple coagulation factor deficiency protein 2